MTYTRLSSEDNRQTKNNGKLGFLIDRGTFRFRIRFGVLTKKKEKTRMRRYPSGEHIRAPVSEHISRDLEVEAFRRSFMNPPFGASDSSRTSLIAQRWTLRASA